MKRIAIAMILAACTTSAPETATQAALQQANAIEDRINKECPQAEITLDMMALRSTIKTQLASCESVIQTYKERNNTLWVIIIAMITLWLFANWNKIKGRFIK